MTNDTVETSLGRIDDAFIDKRKRRERKESKTARETRMALEAAGQALLPGATEADGVSYHDESYGG